MGAARAQEDHVKRNHIGRLDLRDNLCQHRECRQQNIVMELLRSQAAAQEMGKQTMDTLKLRVNVALRHRQNYLKAAEYNQPGETSGHVFISHSHKDTDYTHKLAEEMERRNIPVWIDDRIDYGTRWPHVIQEKIDSCKAFVLIMSDNARASDWVNNELTYAIGKGKKVFPLLLKGDTWLAVASIQYVNVRNRKLPEEAFYKTLQDALT